MSQDTVNPFDILTRFDWSEGDDLELKSARGGLPKSLWETYSAMANTQGGVILLGVEDDGRPSGLHDPSQQKKALWDTLNNRGKVSLNLLRSDDVQQLQHDGKILLAIRVPQATRDQKPVFIGQNPLAGSYRRNYEGDYLCSDQEVRRMLADHSAAAPDSRILEGYGLADLDLPSLHQYRNRLASFKPSHPWLNEDDQSFLAKLGGWRRDRQSETEGITVAGLLMFGRDETLREALPSYHVDYRERLSKEPNERWSDRICPDGTWAPNLFQFYLRVAPRLFADLKLPFQLDDALFRKGESPVHEALREALVNSLIHADHFGQGGVVIEKTRDSFLFSNPGTLLISLDQLLSGQISECRNKTLQTLFMLIGAAEKAGSGVDKIHQGWRSQHWRSPEVREQLQPDRVVWRLPMLSLLPEASIDKLKGFFGKRFKNFSPQEVLALVTADVEDGVNHTRLRQISPLHSSDITRLLQGLVAQGYLLQVGRGRGSRYQVATNHSEHSSPINSLHKNPDSLHKSSIDSLPRKSDSEQKPLDSEHSNSIDSEHSAELLALSAPVRTAARLAPAEMEQVILDLCRSRWLTRNQLAELLQRNAESLRQRFLNPMVQHGLLRLRHPDKPNRVDQAYTAAASHRS